MVMLSGLRACARLPSAHGKSLHAKGGLFFEFGSVTVVITMVNAPNRVLRHSFWHPRARLTMSLPWWGNAYTQATLCHSEEFVLLHLRVQGQIDVYRVLCYVMHAFIPIFARHQYAYHISTRCSSGRLPKPQDTDRQTAR